MVDLKEGDYIFDEEWKIPAVILKDDKRYTNYMKVRYLKKYKSHSYVIYISNAVPTRKITEDEAMAMLI